jgi:HEAT repeat protein
MVALGAATVGDLTQICLDAARATEDRALACLLLGAMRSRASVFMLLEIGAEAQEEETLLIWQSLAAVGAIRSRRATRPLIRLFRTTRSWLKRQAAVFALGQLADKRAERLLIRVLLDPKEVAKTRGFAGEALGLLGPKPQILKVLVAALEDESAEVRYAALCGIGALRSKTALPAVKSLLSDDTVGAGQSTIADRAAKVIKDIEASA